MTAGVYLVVLSEIAPAHAQSSLMNLAIDSEPTAFAINEQKNIVYIGLYNSNQVIVLDGSTNEIIARIDVPVHPYDLEVNQLANKVYVAHHMNDGFQVSVIDGSTNKVIRTALQTQDEVHLAIDQESNLLFAKQAHSFSNSTDTSIFLIDGTTDKLIRTVTIEKSTGPIIFDQNGKLLYVLNYNNTNQIAIFDSAIERQTILSAGNSPIAMVINQDTNTLYVLNSGIAEEQYPAGFVSVIDSSTNQLVANVTVGLNPSAITLNPSLNRIYVAEFTAQRISIIDGNTDRVEEIIQIEGHPESVISNPVTNAIYVSGQDLNNMQVFYDSGVESFIVASKIDGKSYTIAGNSTSVQVQSFSINPNESNISLSIIGSGELELELPKVIIDGVYAVKVGSVEVPFVKIEKTNATIVRFNVPEDSESAQIAGSRVIPEFSVIPLIIALSIMGSLTISSMWKRHFFTPDHVKL
jgi:YVTN family beta-propeller protein